MGSLRRLIGQAEQSQIATAAVSYDKERLIIQTATATIPPTLKYVTYTTAYGTPPAVYLVEPGSPSLRGIGTYRADIIRNRPGSFGWAGTPSLKMRWSAWGNRG